MPLTTGARLGPYEIVSALGAGGMGEVYRARDPRLGRDVAIKVLPATFSADPERLHRFEQEARAAAALNHPNILAVYDIGQHDGSPYIVSELLEGATLRERLQQAPAASRGTGGPAIEQGPLPLRKSVDFAVQIAHGLAAAHEKGISHRDLKPENIFVTSDGRVKILDFGLAKLMQAEPTAAALSALPTTPPNTQAGLVLGTIGYMSPEQVRGLPADHRSDIFAFGAIVYEMLSGQRAFRGDTAADTMSAILAKDPPDLPTAAHHISPALERIVDRCLEKNAATRFQSTRDLAFALEAMSTESGPAAVLTTRAARGTRERLAWALLAIAVLAAGALAVPAARYVSRAAPEPPLTRLDVVTPPTNDPFSFALSPDARQLVFVADGESGPRLWLRPLDQVTAQPLAGTDGAAYPFWAPDGRAIGFFADAKLKRLDLAGGVPQVLADAPNGRGGTWSRDDVIVFAAIGTSGLMRVMATGGTPVPVTQLAAGHGSHRWPQFLPDGRRFIFTVALGQPQTRGVYVAALDGGEPTRVLAAETSAAYAPPGYLLLVSQGVLVAYAFDATRGAVTGEPIPVAQSVGVEEGVGFPGAFSVSAAGVLAHRTGGGARRQLVWVDRTGKVLDAVRPPERNALAHPELAPDGQQLALTLAIQGNPDVWLMTIGRSLTSRFTSDPAVDLSAVWSPDGKRVVFRSSRNGVFDLFEKPASSAADEQPLLVNSQDKAPLDWSRDGRFLLYSTQNAKTASDLWALPMTGERPSTSSGRSAASAEGSGEPGRSAGARSPEPADGGKPFPILQTNFDEVQGQLSPDGRWLAYASNESGRYEIYVTPFPGPGGKWPLSTGGGREPRWRPDGREVFYVAPDDRLMAVPIRLASAAPALDAGAAMLLFQKRLAAGGNIVVGGFNSRAQYAVAPDGRFLMNVAADEAVASPITVVLNWTAGLKK